MSQCLQRLQQLREGETVPVFVISVNVALCHLSVCRMLDQGSFSPDYGNGALNPLVANKSVPPLCVQERLGAGEGTVQATA